MHTLSHHNSKEEQKTIGQHDLTFTWNMLTIKQVLKDIQVNIQIANKGCSIN
jgi:hypothetical protein